MPNTITPADLNTLKTYASAKLGKSYTGKWKDVINNIRWDAYKAIGAVVGGSVAMVPAQICSGPWCIVGGIKEISGLFADVFWIGPYEEGRLIKTKSGGYCELFNTQNLEGGWNGTHYLDQNCRTCRWEFDIGGDTSVVLKFGVPSGRGTAFFYVIDVDQYNPSSPTVTITSTIPGLTHTTPEYGPDGWRVALSAEATVSPGHYTVYVSVPSSHHLRHDWIQAGMEISVESSAYSNHGAIHNTSQVVKMTAPQTPGVGEFPFGIYSRRLFPATQNKPFPWTWREGEKISTETWSVTKPSGSDQGRWYGKTLPICWREIQLQAYMPPNTPPLPGPWNGPIYGFYRDNNPAKLTSQSGDASVIPVTPASTFRGACHPCFRDTDPLPDWSGMYSPPFWYIRQVVVCRHPVLGEFNIMKQKEGTVEFWLGCMRNGSFVAFPDGHGTVGPSGTLLNVQWPVFDQSPLIYHCSEPLSEPLMVYAYVSYEGGQFASDMWSHSIEMPPLLAHINDTYTLLSLVP